MFVRLEEQAGELVEPTNTSNENALPSWAVWIRRQLNGINLVAAGLVILIGTLVVLLGYIPSPLDRPDCSDRLKLSARQLMNCGGPQ